MSLMSIKKSGSVWEKHMGGLSLRATGASLFIMGLLMIYFFEWPWLFGALFSALGFVMFAARESIVINLSRRTVMISRGLFVPLLRTEYDLDSFDKVLINEKERVSRGGSGSSTSYFEFVVQLAGSGKPDVLPVSPSSCSRVLTTNARGAMSISLRTYRARCVSKP